MGKREISKYIKDCLDRGYSFNKIENALIKSGYSKRASEGIILSYRHRGNVFKWLTVFSLSVLFVISIFLSGSGIVGMVTLGYSRSFVDNVGLIINESSAYSWYPPDKGEIVSVAVTGNILGDGGARVYIQNSGRAHLVMDSQLDNFKFTDVKSSLIEGNIKHFEIICEASCAMDGFNKSIYNLVFELNDVVLELENIHYDIRTSTDIESVPEFMHIPTQKVNVGSILSIDLMSFFNSSSGAQFSYIAQDDDMNITLEDSVVNIRSYEVGTSYLYFIAETGGIQFMSNLVGVEVTKGTIRDKLLGGPVKRGIWVEEEKKSPGKGTTVVLLVLALLVIVTLAVIPARYYDMKGLAKRIDGIRRTRDLSDSLTDYHEMKAKLDDELDDDKREKLIDDMVGKIRKMSKDVPKPKLMKEFKERCEEFEKAVVVSKSTAEKVYKELREVYMKILEGDLREKDKAMLYEKMQRYYRKLKN